MQKKISLNALRVLATVAEQHSFKQAAQVLGVTQSAISRQIQTLEEQLGVRLIQRDNRMHALTPQGSLLAPELQRIFSQLETVIDSVSEQSSQDIRRLRIAIHAHYLHSFLAPLLDDFNSLYPHLQLEFTSGLLFQDAAEADMLYQQLQQDTLDVVIGHDYGRTKQLRCHLIAETQLVQVGNIEGPAYLARPLSVQHNSSPILTDSIELACTLASLNHGYTWLPSLMLPQATNYGLSLHKESNEQHSESSPPLYLTVARHREESLALVAFVNWLLHATRTLR